MAIDSVVVGCGRIVDECVQKIRSELKGVIHTNDCVSDVEDIFQHHIRPFEGLQNKYQQEKFYVQEFEMIVKCTYNLLMHIPFKALLYFRNLSRKNLVLLRTNIVAPEANVNEY